MKKAIFLILIGAIFFVFGWTTNYLQNNDQANNKEEKALENLLDKYAIKNLSNTKIRPGKLIVKKVLNDNESYTSYIFEFEFNPNLNDITLKKTTGQLNLPTSGNATENSEVPIIVMFRGYIDRELYKTGDGTRRAAQVFAENGFITLSPDFLGYGGSDETAENIFEARFQTYVTALSLLKTLESLPENNNLLEFAPGLENNYQLSSKLVNQSFLFLWGHSNGGQIALTVLEITRKNYPTILWAPVSKPFPYSVLYYTDQSEDRGKLIRQELAKFEEFHNPDDYSLDLYLDRINAPLQIHQGTADNAVPTGWSNELVDRLEKLGKNPTYYKYQGADHNMNPTWNQVIARDLTFLKTFIK